jgi:hypothetical protein
LTATPSSYAANYSNWPGWFSAGTTDLYLYVDNWNPGVATGAVAESDETNNQFHIGGLTVTGPNPPIMQLQSAAALRERPIQPAK